MAGLKRYTKNISINYTILIDVYVKTILLIVIIITSGCSNKIVVEEINYANIDIFDEQEKDRIEFSRNVISNMDSNLNIVKYSKYNCYNMANVDYSMLKMAHKQKFKYYGHIRYLANKFQMDNYTLKETHIGYDTIHRVVFKNANKNEYITIQYKLNGGVWCFNYIWKGNGLIFGMGNDWEE